MNPEAQQLVATAYDRTLLKTYASLTHRLHANRGPRQDDRLECELRDQRDILEAEILRRMRGGRK